MPACATCGTAFEVSPAHTAKFPGWTPSDCPACWKASRPKGRAGAIAGSRSAVRRSATRGRSRTVVEDNLTTAQVLARHTGGPTDGVFTDGSATPNPGPGGWGAVYVVGDRVVDRAHGHDPATTNNRMELVAIAAGIRLVPDGTPAVVYSDSRLAVDTLTSWAAGWARAGWRRRSGPIANLDLVRPLYAEYSRRPEISIEWIPAHSGNRWNEYADSLATAYLRDEV